MRGGCVRASSVHKANCMTSSHQLQQLGKDRIVMAVTMIVGMQPDSQLFLAPPQIFLPVGKLGVY